MNNMTVAAYTSGSPLPDAHSLHLALRGEDGVFEPLNYGIGVLFAEADFSSGKPAGETIVLDQPVLTRLENGRIAVTALLSSVDGEPRGTASWETEDLVHFTRLPEPLVHSAPSGSAEIDGESVAASLLDLTEQEADYLRRKLGEVKTFPPIRSKLPSPPGRSCGCRRSRRGIRTVPRRRSPSSGTPLRLPPWIRAARASMP